MEKAQIGDVICFERGDVTFEGVVVKINENSVMIEVNSEGIEKLKIPNNKTIVNHKHYKIKK